MTDLTIKELLGIEYKVRQVRIAVPIYLWEYVHAKTPWVPEAEDSTKPMEYYVFPYTYLW